MGSLERHPEPARREGGGLGGFLLYHLTSRVKRSHLKNKRKIKYDPTKWSRILNTIKPWSPGTRGKWPLLFRLFLSVPLNPKGIMKRPISLITNPNLLYGMGWAWEEIPSPIKAKQQTD